MTPRRIRADARIEDNAGRVALQRGPLVYAVEAIDNGGSALDLEIERGAELVAESRSDLLGGVVALSARGSRDGQPETILAVPYFAWANRGPGEMAVWLPVAAPAEPPTGP